MVFRTIKYMGSKVRLLAWILNTLTNKGVRPGRVLDACSGSGHVSWALRKAGYEVVACDALRVSTLVCASAVEYNHHPTFDALLPEIGLTRAAAHTGGPAMAVLQHLSSLPGRECLVTREYSPIGTVGRMYFAPQNAASIDAMRCAIHEYSSAGLLSAAEHDYLLAALVVAASWRANTQGHQDAYLSTFHPNAISDIQLELPAHLPTNMLVGMAVQGDATAVAALLTGLELVYVDPPYNSRRYDRCYHVLERIARGWFAGDVPECVGKTGKPKARDERSPWCGRHSAPGALESFVANVDARHLLMSYSSEGVLEPAHIEHVFRTRGIADSFARTQVPHDRYRGSGTRGGGKVKEYLYYVRMA